MGCPVLHTQVTSYLLLCEPLLILSNSAPNIWSSDIWLKGVMSLKGFQALTSEAILASELTSPSWEKYYTICASVVLSLFFGEKCMVNNEFLWVNTVKSKWHSFGSSLTTVRSTSFAFHTGKNRKKKKLPPIPNSMWWTGHKEKGNHMCHPPHLCSLIRLYSGSCRCCLSLCGSNWCFKGCQELRRFTGKRPVEKTLNQKPLSDHTRAIWYKDLG